MAKARKKREREQWDDLPDKIDFKGLTRDEVPGQGGLLKQLTGRILQKALEASNLRFALTEHPGYEKHDNSGDSEKTVCLENQEAIIRVPRDRNGTFELQIVPKGRKRVRCSTTGYFRYIPPG
jgi:transposase-like protein